MTQPAAVASPTRVALIGCGAVAELYYAPALQVLEEAGLLRVTAIFDPARERLEALRALLPQAAPIARLDGLTTDIADLAIVASPTSHHAEQSLSLLRSGLAVLCEKPMAASVAEAETVHRLVLETEAVYSVAQVRRMFPAAQTIHHIVTAGLLGPLQTFRFVEGGRFDWPVRSPAYFSKQQAGGGVLLDLGAHALDLVLWWFGQPAAVTYRDDAMGGIEANCEIELEFASGLSGHLRFSRDCQIANHYVICGSRGWLRWTVNEADGLELGWHAADYALDATLYRARGADSTSLPSRRAATFQQSFVELIGQMLRPTGGEREATRSASESLRCLRLIEQCYRQRRLLPMPWLSEAELSGAQERLAAAR